MNEIPWKVYEEHRPLAELIHLKMVGKPKTHREWADSFNSIGSLIRLIVSAKTELN